jgi:hypothetical protein
VRPRDGSQPSREELVELSMGGTFIKTMFPEEIGTVLDLEFVLIHGKLRTAAEVCWTRGYEKEPDEPYGMGLKFLDLTSGQKKLLYRHIDVLAKQGGRLCVGKPPRGVQKAGGKETPKPKKRSIWSFLTRK